MCDFIQSGRFPDASFPISVSGVVVVPLSRQLPCGLRALHKEAEFSKDFVGIVDLCGILGVPLAAEKSVEPCTKLTFLGLDIDCHLHPDSIINQDQVKRTPMVTHQKI